MSNGNSLINLGDISKPATVLIEKISDAVGTVFHPYQIKRIARAEAEAEKIKALANIEITEIQRRALARLIEEEVRKQENIESITAQALADLKDNARPEDMDNDWIANFFDKCRLVSNKEMQSLWAKLLAGEANSPGTYSKRTVELVASLDKRDAQLFTNLCTFSWVLVDVVVPLVYDVTHPIYNCKEIYFSTLNHLDSIGLIDFNNITSFVRTTLPQIVVFHYYRRPFTIEFPQKENNEFQLGKVFLTKVGQELAPICGSTPSDEFIEYVLQQWLNFGYITSCPVPNKANAADR